MVYVSEESGQSEVYIRPFPGPGMRYPVSVDGGSTPRWSRDGTEVYYWISDRMMVVKVQTGAELTASAPRELFRGTYPHSGNFYDVAPDGRFLMIRDVGQTEYPSEIVLVEGWFEKLKRLVPAS